jgi:hypothetical protein
MDVVSLFTDEFDQISGVCTTDKTTFGTSTAQCISQRQTTHDMTGTDLQRRINAKEYAHPSHLNDPGLASP